MVRISAVSYLNTKPFLNGLKLSPIADIELSVDVPSEVARKLLEGEVDLGLVPVAIIPLMKEYHILPDFCIGANGNVDSVKLYSNVPLEQIDRVLLDYQSRTSVMLTRILAQEKWKISPEWIKASAGYEEQITGTTAAVVIGDRTFALNGKFAYEFDLAGEWKAHTGLPFIFACWVSNKKLPVSFISAFTDAMNAGLDHIDQVISKETSSYPGVDIDHYLRKSLALRMDGELKAGLHLFLEKVRNYAL